MIRVNRKRLQLLSAIRAASYNWDESKLVRLFCENRISKAVFDKEVQAGRLARQRDDLTNRCKRDQRERELGQ